jgi:hypothetical protein
MITVTVEHAADFTGWRSQARRLLRARIEPADVIWQQAGASSDLFAADDELCALSADA